MDNQTIILSVLLTGAILFLGYQLYLGNVGMKSVAKPYQNKLSLSEAKLLELQAINNEPEVVAVRVQLAKILNGVQKGYCNDKNTMKMLHDMMVRFISSVYAEGACDENTTKIINMEADQLKKNLDRDVRGPFAAVNKTDMIAASDAMLALTLSVRNNLCKIAANLSEKDRKVKFTELAQKLSNVICDVDMGRFVTHGAISNVVGSITDTLLTYQ